jgi:hypothetical protein
MLWRRIATRSAYFRREIPFDRPFALAGHFQRRGGEPRRSPFSRQLPWMVDRKATIVPHDAPRQRASGHRRARALEASSPRRPRTGSSPRAPRPVAAKVAGHAVSSIRAPAFASRARRRRVLRMALSAGSRWLAVGAIASTPRGAMALDPEQRRVKADRRGAVESSPQGRREQRS